MRFVKESRIAAPPSVVFAFHESRGALQRLSPEGNGVEVLEGGDSLRPGSRVVLKVSVGPLKFRWVAEHTEYEPGRLFADRQLRGPFARWEHRHLFLDDGQGGTLLRDEVEYEAPGGRLGRCLAPYFLDGTLHRMFEFRHDATKRIVEAGDFPAAAVVSPRARSADSPEQDAVRADPAARKPGPGPDANACSDI